MTRVVLQPDDLHDLVVDQFGADRRPAALDRLTGGSKKGVYRLRLDDQSTVVLYLWATAENYWPPAPTVPDDPFTDASGAELFATNYAALTAVGVRTPRLLMLDRDGRYHPADLALVEDVGAVTLEALMEHDPAAAVTPLSALGDARLADAHDRITDHLRHLRGVVTARHDYRLIHGELGPDHVLVPPSGAPALVDIEGLTFFDVEWEHAWLQLRFGDAYSALRPVELDPDRLEFYRYAQILSLIEGPLRIAGTDFPDRQWMLGLAERNITKALAAI